jgi:hypothetical protein
LTTAEARRHRQRLVIGLQLITLALVAFIIVYQLGFANPEAQTTKAALCSLRVDRERGITQTKRFLEHPERYPSFADPHTVTAIRAQLVSQQQTVDALSLLDCPS